MTYNEVTKEFKSIYNQELNEKPIDKPKINLLWNCFTDNLNREGKITDKQKFNWLDPIQQKEYLKKKKEGQ